MDDFDPYGEDPVGPRDTAADYIFSQEECSCEKCGSSIPGKRGMCKVSMCTLKRLITQKLIVFYDRRY